MRFIVEGQSAPTASPRRIIESLAIAELSRNVLQRAIEPFPLPVRTLDALHLSTLLFLRDLGAEISLASYDRRMIEAASALEIELAEC